MDNHQMLYHISKTKAVKELEPLCAGLKSALQYENDILESVKSVQNTEAFDQH